MIDLFETPECVIHKISNKSGPDKCVTCGAEKRWVVPVTIDYEAAEIAYSNCETSKGVVDAALGGNG